MKKKPSKKTKKAETYYKIVGSSKTISAFKKMLGY